MMTAMRSVAHSLLFRSMPVRVEGHSRPAMASLGILEDVGLLGPNQCCRWTAGGARWGEIQVPQRNAATGVKVIEELLRWTRLGKMKMMPDGSSTESRWTGDVTQCDWPSLCNRLQCPYCLVSCAPAPRLRKRSLDAQHKPAIPRLRPLRWHEHLQRVDETTPAKSASAVHWEASIYTLFLPPVSRASNLPVPVL
ncbi:hypothetical protein B0H14DRAFT_1244496 [Mycena olivaceomarginata]|nr:hypothetical protein B0H14DRAFT_1244496 [Mycena olivaceomarginata]